MILPTKNQITKMFAAFLTISFFTSFGAQAQGMSKIDRTEPQAWFKVSPFSAPYPDDNFLDFLEGLNSVTNIFQLDEQGLTQGKAKNQPWAGSYWPTHQGILGSRFSDKTFPKSKVFMDNYNNYASRPAEMFIANREIDQLSPAEKYDLLVGDTNWTLTKVMWQKGLDGMAANGMVATWTGICHGWAAVTHVNTPEPGHSVQVMDVTGTHLIKFYAHDIKGILSYVWAQSSPSSFQAGNRCRQGHVDRDEYLRPIDPTCLDSNPMTWHLAIVNRLGLHGESFVMDSSMGPEVWNYPVAGYDYSYFNPRTFESSHSLKAAIEPIKNLTADKYSAYRDPRTRYVVGIALDVFHPALIQARTGDSAGNSMTSNAFIYDLELDENYTVIGGEWYSKERPDFIWTFPTGSKAGTREDSDITEIWDGKTPLPQSFADKAKSATQRGKVLNKIAETLLNESLTTVDAPNPDL